MQITVKRAPRREVFARLSSGLDFDKTFLQFHEIRQRACSGPSRKPPERKFSRQVGIWAMYKSFWAVTDVYKIYVGQNFKSGIT